MGCGPTNSTNMKQAASMKSLVSDVLSCTRKVMLSAGYNVQTAVDDKHHLIIAHELTNVGNDRGQLSNMAHQARAEIGAESLTVVADRGYYKGLEILAC